MIFILNDDFLCNDGLIHIKFLPISLTFTSSIFFYITLLNTKFLHEIHIITQDHPTITIK